LFFVTDCEAYCLVSSTGRSPKWYHFEKNSKGSKTNLKNVCVGTSVTESKLFNNAVF